MNDTKQPIQLQVPLILWAAILTSHVLFVGVGLFLRQQAPAAPAEDLDILSLVLTGAGVLTALASALGGPLLSRSQDFAAALIIRFALAESATIFGLVLSMLGAELKWFLILAGLGVVAHISAFPTTREAQQHAKQTMK